MNDLEDWVKKTAEGDITEYMRGLRKITLEWVIAHLRFLKTWGLTKTDLEEIMRKAELDPIYKPIQNKEGLTRLAEIRKRVEKEFD